MRIRYRLMLAAAVALTVSLFTVGLWPEPAVIPGAAPPGVPDTLAREPLPEPAGAPVAADAVSMSLAQRLPAATVVEPRPGDVEPEPEVENPPPQYNDAIEPELPQTPQWRLEKTAHITALLGRDVERMERELEDAEARGDEERIDELELLIRRNRVRLDELREELDQLSQAAQEASSGE